MRMRTPDAVLSSLCLILMLDCVLGAVPNYYTGPAVVYDNPNSCPVAPCAACPLGSYSSGCGGLVSIGQCGQCQTLPDGANWDQPSYALPCSWACNSGKTLVNGACVTIGSYATAVTVAMPLTVAQITSSIQPILASFEALAGCTGCPVVNVIPANGITCSNCQLSMTATALSTSRRLLAVSTSLIVSIVQTSSSAASSTAGALTASSINAQLTANSLPAATVIAPAAIIVVTTPTTPPPGTTQTVPPATTTAAPPPPPPPDTTTQAVQVPPDTTTQAVQVPPDTTLASRRDTTSPDTTAPSSSSSSGSSNAAVIGGAVGGVVVVLLIIGGVVFCALKVPAKTTIKSNASGMRVNARLMRGEQQVYTRQQRLPGQPFMGQESPRLVMPGAAARQPPQLHASPPQLFHPQFQQPQVISQRAFQPPFQQPIRQQQRPRFYSSPAQTIPLTWA